ncbi:MAG: pilus assembly protein HicB [Tetrasphaera sp.]|jgi:hypothetical protein|nr:pilus assembly protein HicB [Tetrasphaera sp.]
MDITPYADRLRAELFAVAEGDPDLEDAVRRLARVLDPAMRLTLLEVLSDAAAEITSALPAGNVTARLAGRAVDFVVDGLSDATAGGMPFAPHPAPPVANVLPVHMPQDSSGSSDEGDIARITVRLPEGIKEKAERQAGTSSQSLNSWIVNTLRDATRPGGLDIDLDLSQVPFLSGDLPQGFPFPPNFPFGKGSGGRMKGWV